MRSLAQRLRDHVTDVTLPRVASELGPGWRAEGFRLTSREGEDFGVDLSWLADSPVLVIYPNWRLAERAEDPVRTSVMATATPQTIARTMRADLFAVCAPHLFRLASGPESAEGRNGSEGKVEHPSKAAAA